MTIFGRLLTAILMVPFLNINRNLKYNRRFGSTILAFICLSFVSGCISKLAAISQPQDGYDGVRFRQAIQIRDHALNNYTFSAGAVFIADRMGREELVYCGSALVNDGLVAVCIGVEKEDAIIIGPGAGFKEVRRPVPLGSIERIKIKF